MLAVRRGLQGLSKSKQGELSPGEGLYPKRHRSRASQLFRYCPQRCRKYRTRRPCRTHPSKLSNDERSGELDRVGKNCQSANGKEPEDPPGARKRAPMLSIGLK